MLGVARFEYVFFFFQAEDGIRDVAVTGVQTCALPIWLGLGYPQLAELNAATIMVRLSGYGQTGPMRDRPGFGAIGEAMGGIRHVTGHPDRPPVRIGLS